jgi:hypothetical protein
MRTLLILAALTLGLATSALAQNSPYIVSPDGQFLGNLNRNTLDPNSVYNPLGRYGSSLSPDSINNPLGRYGSTLSPYSANNPLATNPPRVYAPRNSFQSYGTRRY